jgi:CRISPR system Cascade subunit CasD
VVSAADLHEAFATQQCSLLSLARQSESVDVAWPSWEDKSALHLHGEAVRYCWENGMKSGMEPELQIVRIDQPLSRRRWQFAPRRELVHFERGGKQ